MELIQPLNTLEIEIFNLYLLELADLVVSPRAANYGVEFDVKCLQVSDSTFSVESVMLAAYPECNPQKGIVRSVDFQEMAKTVKECLLYQRSHLTNEAQQKICADYWSLIEDCIDFKNSLIFSFVPQVGGYVGLPGCIVMWMFAFIIYNPSQKRCVIIYGSASD